MLFKDGPGLRVPHGLLEWSLSFRPWRQSMGVGGGWIAKRKAAAASGRKRSVDWESK